MSADGQPSQTTSDDDVVPVRPALDVPPLAAWWLIAAGLVVGMLFFYTDHVLRATLACGGSLVLAAALRVALPESRAGGIVVRNRWVDVATLLLLAAAVLVSGFTLDLGPR